MDSRKRLQLLIFIGVMLFLGGLYYLYTQMTLAGDRWPFENEPGSLTVDINSLNRDIADLNIEVRKIPDAQRQLDELTVDYAVAERIVPRESDDSQLINAIRTKAIQSGVVPDRLTPAQVAQSQQQRGRTGGGANLEVRSFSLSIRGSYDQIGSFVNRMEEFETNDPSRAGSENRFFQVSSIDITSEDNGMSFLLLSGGEGENFKRGHTCNLVMQTYRYAGE